MVQYKKAFSGESGAVPVVEAVFVYPIVIFVVIIFMMLGNMFYQQSRIESIAARGAQKLAAYYANQFLASSGLPTNAGNINLDPYRYLFSSSAVEAAVRGEMEDELSKIGDGAFAGMKVHGSVTTCDVDNNVVSQTAKVRIAYSIDFEPLKLIGANPHFNLGVTACSSAADPAEFIRNVDMILDYNEKYGVTDKISEKLKATVGKFTGH